MEGAIHILRPYNPCYQARVRHVGRKRYELEGKPCKTYRAACLKLAEAMATKKYKRGDVLMCTYDYYDPCVLIEMVRR